MRRFLCILLVALMIPACAVAELKRGDSGDDVLRLQQMLWETGFIFEEPDGSFGKNTESAVKRFQEYAGLNPTGAANENTLNALYDCWLQLLGEQGINAPDDQVESQGAGFVPGYNAEGDYPACCQRYATEAGDEHIEPCARHAALIENESVPEIQKWTNELNALYDEWLALSPEEDRAVIVFSQAFFMLWLEQQSAALEQQNAAGARVETLLRDQCVDLCNAVYELRAE